MGSRAVFERNLAAIRKRSPQLADALAKTDAAGIEEVEGPRGAVVLRERGVLLGSAYDPKREAEQIAETMASEPADIMVAIGFGLGDQFPHYCEQNPATVIVFEPSVARLRAALHRFCLTNLYATNRDFYITTDLEHFSRLLDHRYFPGLRIRVFPHPAVLRLDPEAVGRAVERTRRVKDAADTGRITTIERMMPWARLVAGNGRRIASSASLRALVGPFEGKPAVIVAAGPSLDKQLPLLKEREDHVLIIAIGQTVKALAAAGITPHLVHVLESRNVSHQLTDGGDSRELNVVLSPDCHPAIYDVPVRGSFVATPSVNPMGAWIETVRGDPCLTIGGGTVALGAVAVAQALGSDPVMLIGQDLAFTEGRAYAKNSAYDFVGVELSEDGECSFTNGKRKVALLGDEDVDRVRDRFSRSDVVWVDGWHEGERVPTWRAYASFIEQYRDAGLFLAQSGIRLVNCTEGGARIPGIEHLAFREVLDALPSDSLEAFATIDRAFREAPRHDLSDFADAIRKARRSLERIEQESRKALRFAKRNGSRLLRGKDDQQTIDVLRRLARHEKKLRTQLDRMPWLDALVQPEIYSAMAASRRTERQDPGLEELLEESLFLFEAVCHGVVRARSWFDHFEASFDEGAGNGAGPDRREGKPVRRTDSPDLAAVAP
ncbi:MAG TPA: DUF115 domain-containing protein [Deltaproteobacteria bacterium]|nr:DUF115 domain-containing protein [Deltaproteobacteria bacterium]